MLIETINLSKVVNISTTQLDSDIVIDMDIRVYLNNDITIQLRGANVNNLTKIDGLYRWSGTAYLPGPRVLDFRHTAADGTVTTVAEDVDSATFSNDFTVSSDGTIGITNAFTPEEDIARILTNLPAQDTTITRSQDGGEDVVYWIEICLLYTSPSPRDS